MTHDSTHPSQCAGLHRRCWWLVSGRGPAGDCHAQDTGDLMTHQCMTAPATLPAAMHSRLCVAKLTLPLLLLNVKFQILVRDSEN